MEAEKTQQGFGGKKTLNLYHPSLGRRYKVSPRAPASGDSMIPQVHLPLISKAWGPDPRVPRAPSSPWLGGNHGSMLCGESGVHTETERVWENLVPQKPVIEACGNAHTYGAITESSLAVFRKILGSFTIKLSESTLLPLQPLERIRRT